MEHENERKDVRLTCELKGATLDENMISGAAAVMGNVDSYGDVIFPGAFKGALKDFLKTGFVPDAHQWGSMASLVAMPKSAKEQGRELVCTAKFHGTDHAQAVRQICIERLAEGLSVGLSIGFSIDYGDDESRMWFESGAQMLKYVKDTGLDLSLFDVAGIKAWGDRHCRAVFKVNRLFEFSPVPIPANSAAVAMSVKGAAPDGEKKSKATSVGEILQAKIHQSFTIAADEIAIRGYMTTEERIALSKNISLALETFRAAIDPAVASREIEADDVDWIAAKQFDLLADSRIEIGGEAHAHAVLTAVKGWTERMVRYAAMRKGKGRTLSDARRSEIEAAKAVLDGLLTSTETKAPEGALRDLQLQALSNKRAIAELA